MPPSKTVQSVTDDWYMACKHCKDQERVTLQVRDMVNSAEKPRHEKDFEFGKKYLISTVTKSFDEKLKKLVHVRKRYKVFIGRIAATKESLQASILKSRLRFPTANPRDSDSQGTESELDKAYLSPRENPSIVHKLKRNAGKSDMLDMSALVGDILLQGTKKRKLSGSDSSQTNQHSVHPCGDVCSKGSVAPDVNVASSPISPKVAVVGASTMVTPKLGLKSRASNPQSAKAKASAVSNSQSGILSLPSSSFVSVKSSTCSTAVSPVPSVSKTTESGFLDGLVSSDSTDLNSLFVVTDTSGEPISSNSLSIENSHKFKVAQSVGDTGVLSSAVDLDDADPQLQIKYWKEKYLTSKSSENAVLSELKTVSSALVAITSRLDTLENQHNQLTTHMTSYESKETHQFSSSQKRVACWLANCEFDLDASFPCDSFDPGDFSSCN